jgi:hypothetical protein
MSASRQTQRARALATAAGIPHQKAVNLIRAHQAGTGEHHGHHHGIADQQVPTDVREQLQLLAAAAGAGGSHPPVVLLNGPRVSASLAAEDMAQHLPTPVVVRIQASEVDNPISYVERLNAQSAYAAAEATRHGTWESGPLRYIVLINEPELMNRPTLLRAVRLAPEGGVVILAGPEARKLLQTPGVPDHVQTFDLPDLPAPFSSDLAAAEIWQLNALYLHRMQHTLGPAWRDVDAAGDRCRWQLWDLITETAGEVAMVTVAAGIDDVPIDCDTHATGLPARTGKISTTVWTHRHDDGQQATAYLSDETFAMRTAAALYGGTLSVLSLGDTNAGSRLWTIKEQQINEVKEAAIDLNDKT